MNFKEWFKTQVINEGVSVVIDMPTMPARPIKNLGDLCMKLFTKFSAHVPSLSITAFAADGDDDMKTQGIINFYTRNLDDPIIHYVLNNISKIAEELNAKIEPSPTSNTYKDYITKEKEKYPKTNIKKFEKLLKDQGITDLNKIRVYRFKAEIKPVENHDEMPRIEMGFETARIIFEEIFGLPSAGANPVHSLTKLLSGEEPESSSSKYEGYQFTADHIINVYERLKGIKQAENLKVYVVKNINGEKIVSIITYREFLANKPPQEVAHSTAENDDGNWRITKTEKLPKGNFDIYFFDKTMYYVPVVEETNDLEMIAGMEQIPPSTTTKTTGQEDKYGIFQDQPYQEEPRSKMTFHDFGVNKQLILHRVEEIYKLALWAKRHGYNKMFAY